MPALPVALPVPEGLVCPVPEVLHSVVSPAQNPVRLMHSVVYAALALAVPVPEFSDLPLVLVLRSECKLLCH